MNQPTGHRRRFFLKFITAFTVLAYLASVAGWYLSPTVWWPLGLASIGFAYFWMVLFALAIWWWRKKQLKTACFCLFLMAAGFQPAHVTFSIGWNKAYEPQKAPNTLRVMQWNCKELPGNHIGWKKDKDERKAIETFVLHYKPDVICMQDFAEHIGKKLESNYAFLKDTLGYPYKIFAQSSYMIHVFGKTIGGTAIYSRQPFLDSGIIQFTNREYGEYIVWADVLLEGKKVRVVTTHFRSMNLFSSNAYDSRKLPYYLQADSVILMSTNPFLKMKFYQHEHAIQAEQLRAFLDTCSVPVVLGMDMNTVPASFTYKQARGNFEDGFIGSKTGVGNTYNYVLPNLRIDYLLNHPALEAKQWKHFTNGFFDHDHLMGDFAWKGK